MDAAFRIAPALGEDDLRAVAILFAGYAESLPFDLGYQAFADELAALPGKYAPPGGVLFLARDTRGEPVGCAALRAIDSPGCCEMKRLFLHPEARGLGLGRALAATVIEHARRLGYTELRLDTLPTMTAAIALYDRLGFARIDAYYEPTPPGTVFMAFTL